MMYDGENKLGRYDKDNAQANPTTYLYDADGKRKQSVDSFTVRYIHGLGGELLAEANAIEVTKEYGYRNGDLLITALASKNPKVKWLVKDHLGTPRIVADGSGNLSGIKRHDYLPFGEEIGPTAFGRSTSQGYGTPQSDGVRQQFTGYERDDESGLDFAEARMFGSSLGRFMSADDFANDSQTYDPQSWNKYLYVRDNPLKYVDVNGKKATITIETDEEKKTVRIKIDASIAFYAKDGISMEKLNEAAKKTADQIAKAWAGNFKKDGMSVTVDTSISWTTSATKEDAESRGSQNVIGFSDGEAIPGKADSYTASGVWPNSADIGVFNINTIDSGVPAHEFGHLLGVGNRETGNELMNTNLLSNPNNSTAATKTDFLWTFGGAIENHRSISRPRIPNPETRGFGLHNTQRGDPQSSRSSTLMRAGRVWWN